MNEAVLRRILANPVCPICSQSWQDQKGSIYQVLFNRYHKTKDVNWIREEAEKYGWTNFNNRKLLEIYVLPPNKDGVDHYICPYCDCMWRGDTGTQVFHADIEEILEEAKKSIYTVHS